MLKNLYTRDQSRSGIGSTLHPTLVNNIVKSKITRTVHAVHNDFPSTFQFGNSLNKVKTIIIGIGADKDNFNLLIQRCIVNIFERLIWWKVVYKMLYFSELYRIFVISSSFVAIKTGRGGLSLSAD